MHITTSLTWALSLPVEHIKPRLTKVHPALSCNTDSSEGCCAKCCAAFQHSRKSSFLVSGWSTGSGFDLIGPSFQSSKHLCIFRLCGAM